VTPLLYMVGDTGLEPVTSSVKLVMYRFYALFPGISLAVDLLWVRLWVFFPYSYCHCHSVAYCSPGSEEEDMTMALMLKTQRDGSLRDCWYGVYTESDGVNLGGGGSGELVKQGKRRVARRAIGDERPPGIAFSIFAALIA